MNQRLKKLKISPPHRFLCLDAPADFEIKTAQDTKECTFSADPSATFDSIHWFVRNKLDIDHGFNEVLALARPGMPVWIYYPKTGSGIATDLTRDKGWETMTGNEAIRWLSMISFDDTWTAFSFRLKTEKDLAEEAKPKEERAIFQYADSSTKTITLPEDMKQLFEAHPAEKAIFDALSFSNRREYVEWIVSAKQVQTRQNRLAGAIEKLQKGFKNPSGR